MKRAQLLSGFIGLSLILVFRLTAVHGQDSVPVQTQAITNSIGMSLVPIPAGRFTMGSPASEPGSQEEEVLHKVDLTQAFYLGATEVTEHQWAMVMEEPFKTELVEIRDPGTKRLVKKEERQIKNPKLDSQLPVTGISWVQAVDFCKRLSQLPEEKKEGRSYRLPTEAEWEYACRAGTSTAYSFGDDASVLSDYAWFEGNSRGKKAMPAAQKKPNDWGLFDMHGNVAEWCHDYWGNYSEGLTSDPVGPEKLIANLRIIRGGSIQNDKTPCRSGWRGRVRPLNGSESIGFRVVLGPLREVETESVVNSIGQSLVRVPAGHFLMGNNDIDKDEGPRHEVLISQAFHISATEVTQKQWTAVMGTKPWKDKKGVVEGDEYPATYVSWHDALTFCRRLSGSRDEQAAGREYSLPTEAQWEYSCRGGTQTRYCFGDDPSLLWEYGWHSGNTNGHPEAVKQKQGNGFGLYDMHGNVWEWCSDLWKKEYTDESATDPTGPHYVSELIERRVVRGGSWYNDRSGCRSTYRDGNKPSNESPYLGFRVIFTSKRK